MPGEKDDMCECVRGDDAPSQKVSDANHQSRRGRCGPRRIILFFKLLYLRRPAALFFLSSCFLLCIATVTIINQTESCQVSVPKRYDPSSLSSYQPESHSQSCPGSGLPHRPSQCSRALTGDWPGYALLPSWGHAHQDCIAHSIALFSSIVQEPFPRLYGWKGWCADTCPPF